MRILMTADTVGGVWTYALDLIARLTSSGASVYLATLGRALTDFQHEQLRRVPGITLFESRFKLCWMEDPWADVEAAGAWLLDLCRQLRPDLVHLNDFAHGALPWNVPVLVVGHSCVLSWHRQVLGRDADDSWHRYRQVVQRGLRAADLVVAPTGTMLRWLDHFYGLPERSAVVLNGFCASRFSTRPKYPKILAAGRIWDDGKNVAALVRAARHVPWPIEVAGEQRPPGTTHSKPLQLEHVIALGPLDPPALAERYAQASIYALPARYEPFGLTALEAALSGCALVLGDIPTLREVWGDAAAYVPPDDTRQLADTLNRLIAAPSIRVASAQRARERALRLTAQRMADQYIELYEQLLSLAAVHTSHPAHERFGRQATHKITEERRDACAS